MNANSTTTSAKPQGSKTFEAREWSCHAPTTIFCNGSPVAECGGMGLHSDTASKNAAFISEACNEHAALVSVAEAAKVVESGFEDEDHPWIPGATAKGLRDNLRIALANLAAVRNGGGK